MALFLTLFRAPVQWPVRVASTALALAAGIARRPESANRIWPGDCFPTLPIWPESNLAAPSAAVRDTAPPGSPARPLWTLAGFVVQFPSRAWAGAQRSLRSRGPACLEQGP